MSETGEMLRGTGSELSRYLRFFPHHRTDGRYGFTVSAIDEKGAPSMSVGSCLPEDAEKMEAMMRAFHVGLVLGAQQRDRVLESTERHRPLPKDSPE